MRRIAPWLALTLTGCGGLHLPDNPIVLTSDIQIAADTLVAAAVVGAVAYYVIDPKAPNWEVKATRLDTTRVEIFLRRKRFAAGGDGEAIEVFHRNAAEIASRNGADGYSVISYTEGIDSETTIARRVSRGVVRLQPRV